MFFCIVKFKNNTFVVEDLSANDLLLKENILVIEHLNNLDRVAGNRMTICAVPIKLHGGDGAPARVLAILDEQ